MHIRVERISEHADGGRRGPVADPKGSPKARLARDVSDAAPRDPAVAPLGVRRRRAPRRR